MTKDEFIKIAKNFNYEETTIAEMITNHETLAKELGEEKIDYDLIPLMEQPQGEM